MVLRRSQVSSRLPSDALGAPQLTLAYLIIYCEKFLRVFARPLMLAAGFVILAWFGVFEHLYPWVHILALAAFITLVFGAIGRSRLVWQPVSPAEAKRRVEVASRLFHRPFDVLEDSPVSRDPEQFATWQVHVARTRQKLNHLQWPTWMESFSDRDPYAIRYALLILLAIGAVCGWGALGGRIIDSINPTLGKQLHMVAPTLDAWIAPPEYTGLPPIMIATPADMRHSNDVIEVPEGSTVNAHLAEKDGRAPVLIINDAKTEFTSDSHGDFEAKGVLQSGDKITIRRGWQTMGSWKIHVVPDSKPEIAFSDPPSVTERKTVRLAYEASDDYGVTSVKLRISPRESLPGADSDPIELSLATPNLKQVTRVNFEDLTSHPWAGLAVDMTLIATDAAGHSSESKPSTFVLPEREFFHPVARALIDERKKLLQQPDEDAVRNEAANIMAAVAHQPNNYKGDPVVLMALRSGAVRLVLDHSHDSGIAVNNLLWQSAVRIENGSVGVAEDNLHQAQKELADALDHNASEQDIQSKLDHLRQALAQYLAQLSMRMAQHPQPAQDLSQLLGDQTNMLTPQDLEQMLNKIGDLSASNAKDAARQQLSQLQQMLDNIKTDQPELTTAQKQQIQHMAELQDLIQLQQKLLDKTFRNAEKNDVSGSTALSVEQTDLGVKLQDIVKQIPEKENQTKQSLSVGTEAMQQAGQTLKQHVFREAMGHQNDALKAMKSVMKSMASELRMSVMMMPGQAMGSGKNNKDPSERGSQMTRDENGVKVPDHMETHKVREIMDELQRRAGDMSRSKTERDYIERLLQNF